MYKLCTLTATRGNIVHYVASPNESYFAIALSDNSIILYEKNGNAWQERQSLQITLKTQEKNSTVSKIIFSKDENILIVLCGSSIYYLQLRISTANSVFYERSSEMMKLSQSITTEGIKDILAVHRNLFLIIKERNILSLSINYDRDNDCKLFTYEAPIRNYALSNDFFSIVFDDSIYLCQINTTGISVQTKLPKSSNKKNCAFSPCGKYFFTNLDAQVEAYECKLRPETSISPLNVISQASPNFTFISFKNKRKLDFILLKEVKRAPRVIEFTEEISTFLTNLPYLDYIFSPDKKQCLYFQANTIHIVNFTGNLPQYDTLLERLIREKVNVIKDFVIDYFPSSNNIILNFVAEISIIYFSKKKKFILESPARMLVTTQGRVTYHSDIGEIKCGALSSRGNFLATVFKNHAEIRRLSDNLIIQLYLENAGEASCCTFSLDEQYFVMGFNTGKIKFLPIDFTQLNELSIKAINMISIPKCIYISKDNRKIIAQDEDGYIWETIRVWNMGFTLPNTITLRDTLLYSHHEHGFLSYSHNQVSSLNLNNYNSTKYPLIIDEILPQQALGLLPPPSLNDSEISTTDSTLRTASFSSNSSSSGNRTITSNSTILSYKQKLNEVACFSSDGSYLAIQRHNRTEIFDVQFQKMVQSINYTNAAAYEFSPGNDYLAIISGKQLCIYDVALGNLIQTITEAHIIRFCKFSSDMKSIFLGVDNEGLVNFRLNLLKYSTMDLMKKAMRLDSDRNIVYFYSFKKDAATERTVPGKLFINDIDVTAEFQKNSGQERINNMLTNLRSIIKKDTNLEPNEISLLSAFIFSIYHQAAVTFFINSFINLIKNDGDQKIYYTFSPLKFKIHLKNIFNNAVLLDFKFSYKAQNKFGFDKLGGSLIPTVFNNEIIVDLNFCYLFSLDSNSISDIRIMRGAIEFSPDAKAEGIPNLFYDYMKTNASLIDQRIRANSLVDGVQKMSNIKHIAQKIFSGNLTITDLDFDIIPNIED